MREREDGEKEGERQCKLHQSNVVLLQTVRIFIDFNKSYIKLKQNRLAPLRSARVIRRNSNPQKLNLPTIPYSPGLAQGVSDHKFSVNNVFQQFEVVSTIRTVIFCVLSVFFLFFPDLLLMFLFVYVLFCFSSTCFCFFSALFCFFLLLLLEQLFLVWEVRTRGCFSRSLLSCG